MRIEKINEHQVRCVLTKQDLAARNMALSELRYGNRETAELFKEMLTQAASEYHFNEEELPLMIEAVPMSQEELLIIISAVEDAEELDPHFAKFSNPLELESTGNTAPGPRFIPPDTEAEGTRVCIVRMGGIDEAVGFARHLKGFSGESFLYRNPQGGFYLVLKRPGEMTGRDFNCFANSISEFGEVISASAILYAKLKEHDQPVMDNVLEKLKNL